MKFGESIDGTFGVRQKNGVKMNEVHKVNASYYCGQLNREDVSRKEQRKEDLRLLLWIVLVAGCLLMPHGSFGTFRSSWSCLSGETFHDPVGFDGLAAHRLWHYHSSSDPDEQGCCHE